MSYTALSNDFTLQGSRRECPTPYPKDNLEEKLEIHQELVYEDPQDRFVCSPSYSPILPHFPRVLTRIVGQVIFNTNRQWYEFVDSPGTAVNLTNAIYHENYNKCYFFTNISEFRSGAISNFLSST